EVGVLHRLGGRLDGEAVGLGLGLGRAARTQPDGHVEARVAQVQRMRAALAAVTDDGDAGLGKGGLGHLGSLAVTVCWLKAGWATKNPALAVRGSAIRRLFLTRPIDPHLSAR